MFELSFAELKILMPVGSTQGRTSHAVPRRNHLVSAANWCDVSICRTGSVPLTFADDVEALFRTHAGDVQWTKGGSL